WLQIIAVGSFCVPLVVIKASLVPGSMRILSTENILFIHNDIRYYFRSKKTSAAIKMNVACNRNVTFVAVACYTLKKVGECYGRGCVIKPVTSVTGKEFPLYL
ncbi:MAG: hypothetical protein ABR512_10035, partial [Desulfopila sp.]